MAVWTWRRDRSTMGILYLCVVLLSLSLPYRVHGEEVDKITENIIDAEIDTIGDSNKHQGLIKLRRFVEIVAGVKVNDLGSNKTLYSDNSLWRNLITDCGQKTTLSCVKDNVFGYLDHSMGLDGDLSITDNLIFTRNAFVENKYDRKLNEMANNEHKIVETSEKKSKPETYDWIPTSSDADSGRSFTGSGPNPEVASSGDVENNAVSDVSTFEGVTDTLYDKGVRFLASHDLKFQLPEMFGGALLRISPRAFGEDGGALVKLEINPRRQEEGRFFGFFKEKIKGKIKKKLMMAFLAIILVVKLIKLKLLFLLPMLIGAGAAKKILLKVLLFLFPAFSHLFKFCSYYHGLHAQKYYHHHHQIAHHHHHIPVPVPVHTEHHSHHGGGGGYGESHVGGGYPPPEPPSYGGDYGGGHPSSHQRKDQLTHAQIVQQNENELASWGLGHGQAYKGPYNSYYDDQRLTRSAQPVTEATSYFPRPQPMKTPAYRKQEQLPSPARYPYSPHKVHLPPAGGGISRQQSLNNLRVQVQTPSPLAGTTVHVAYDPFYSPILQKMDNVFAQLGFNEEACRERLVCSMYKSPSRFSPHSNLISAELSRDPHELQKPDVIVNTAIARFHRYVEAARAGQDMGDCIRLYPSCTVNTE